MDENSVKKFKCFNCRKHSRYLERAGRTIMEFKVASIAQEEPKTRTYVCEHCDSENRVTHSELEWMAIEFGNLT